MYVGVGTPVIDQVRAVGLVEVVQPTHQRRVPGAPNRFTSMMDWIQVLAADVSCFLSNY